MNNCKSVKITKSGCFCVKLHYGITTVYDKITHQI